MRRGVDMYIEIVFLILMLAMSASFTFFAVENLSGKTAHVADDKVLVVQGKHLTEEQLSVNAETDTDRMLYDVRSLLLTIMRFDYGYPFDYIEVTDKDKSGTVKINVKDESTLSDPRPTMAKIVKLSGIESPKKENYETEEQYEAAKAQHDKAMQAFYAQRCTYRLQRNNANQLVCYVTILKGDKT